MQKRIKRTIMDFNAIQVPQLTIAHIGMLPPSFTFKENKSMVFNLNPNKAPRPDSFLMRFCQAFWKIVGTQVSNMIISFFTKGTFLKELNQTLIYLIPKGSF